MSRLRFRSLGVLAAASTAALVVLSAVPASAAGSSTGWLRLAHLSPDTKQVDVTLTSLAGHTVVEKLSKVGYGDVSPYIKLPTGTYAIAMVPAGAPASTTPLVKAAVTVDNGKAETVAAMNFNRDIETHVYSDDLAIAANTVRVRVLEASANHRTVSVRSGSTTIDNGVQFSHVTGYATVPAGTVPITVSAGSTTATKSFSFGGGSVHTLFVLDTAAGGLTVSTVLDSAAAALVPQGSVNTGGGALAGNDSALVPVAALLALVAAAGAGGTGLLLARRPRRTESARA